jgi:hypothetical protein
VLIVCVCVAEDDLFMSGAESMPPICLGQTDKKPQLGDGHWHLVKLPSTSRICQVAVGVSHCLAVTGMYRIWQCLWYERERERANTWLCILI